MTSEKVYTDPEAGTVTLRKNRRSRRISLRVHPVRGVTVSMPRYVPYALGLEFFMSRRDWVLGVLEKQGTRQPEAKFTEEELEALREAAKASLPERLAELAGRHGFVYNAVRIKNNVSNWGSCSTRGNINLNLHLIRLPKELQDYVMLHELCHLRHPDHGPGFKALLDSLCRSELSLPARELERAVRGYSPASGRIPDTNDNSKIDYGQEKLCSGDEYRPESPAVRSTGT